MFFIFPIREKNIYIREVESKRVAEACSNKGHKCKPTPCISIWTRRPQEEETLLPVEEWVGRVVATHPGALVPACVICTTAVSGAIGLFQSQPVLTQVCVCVGR